MEFVATCMPGLADLLSDELSSLGISVTEAGRAHVSFSGGSADALKVCLWSRLSERVLLHLATLGVTPDIAPEKLAASQDWLSLVANDAPVHVHIEHGAEVRGDNRISAKRFIQALPEQFAISREPKGSCCIRARPGPERGALVAGPGR